MNTEIVCFTREKKRSYKPYILIVFTLVLFLANMSYVSARDLTYTCKYKSDKASGELRIYADLSYEYKITKWGSKTGVSGSIISVENWDNVKKDIGRLGCPTRVRYYSNFLGASQAKAFWSEDTANKEVPDPTFKLSLEDQKKSDKVCFYKGQNDGTTGGHLGDINDGKGLGGYFVKKGSNSVKFVEMGVNYNYTGNNDDFYSTGSFKCVPLVYIRYKASIREGVPDMWIIGTKNIGSGDAVSDSAADDDTEKDLEDDRLDEDNPDQQKKEPKGLCQIIDPNGSTYAIIKQVVQYVQIGTIFLILVLGMMDLAGAVGSDKDDAFKKAIGKFGKRLIAGALIFLVPVIVSFILNLVNLGQCGGTLTDANGKPTSGYDLFK